jgi:hypothetical protein
MLVSVILSLKAFRLKWPPAYKIFSVLLFTALFTEAFANAWRFYLHDFNGWKYSSNNAWIFTISLAPQYVLFMLVYYHELHAPKLKKAVLITCILFSLFTILNFCFWQKLDMINSYTHILADCIMLLLVFAYFEQLRREKTLIRLTTRPMVWISLGVMVFHLLNIPFLMSINYLNQNFKTLADAFYYGYLLFIFMCYVLYSKAFLCQTPQLK